MRHSCLKNTKMESESVWQGNPTDSISIGAAVFETGQLKDRTRDSLHKIQPDGEVIEPSFEVCMCVSVCNPGRCLPDAREYYFLRLKRSVLQ